MSRFDSELDKIQAAVERASSFMDVGNELKKIGVNYNFSTSMMPVYTIKIPGNTIGIVNAKYAAGAEREVNGIAIGLLENIGKFKKSNRLTEGRFATNYLNHKRSLSESKIPKEYDHVTYYVEYRGNKYPYYITYIDSTHVAIRNTPPERGGSIGAVYHIGQLREKDYYEPLIHWMRTGDDRRINNQVFTEGKKLRESGNHKRRLTEDFKHLISVDTPTEVVSKRVAAQIEKLARSGVRSKDIGLEIRFIGNEKLANNAFQKLKNAIYFKLDNGWELNLSQWNILN